jgi:RNA polymerase sigma-70 factor (ECF subfamily)
MLGSFHDAEDAVQETLLRAWRGLEAFEGRASMRQWLYRIATNACLNAIAARKGAGRVLPDTERPPTDQMPDREPASDVAWLEPYPDAALEGLEDDAPGPDARYQLSEAVNLAFIAAIQHLPPKQRAVLLLRDVLGWSAAETARLVESSIAGVNSALQRARATLERRVSSGPAPRPRRTTERQRELLAHYVHAWESSDVDRFAALLREDASFRMPPWPQWYRGRDAIRSFFAWTTRLGGHAPFRLLPTRANGEPAFAFYGRWQGPEWRFHSIQLVTLQDEMIAGLTSFVMPELAPVFGLPGVLPEASNPSDGGRPNGRAEKESTSDDR